VPKDKKAEEATKPVGTEPAKEPVKERLLVVATDGAKVRIARQEFTSLELIAVAPMLQQTGQAQINAASDSK